jgi:exodeoxyribonuclease V alpha subunit
LLIVTNLCWASNGGIIPLYATTIHRALGLQSEEDEGPEAFKSNKRIECRVLIIEEASMISSPLPVAILKNSRTLHTVFAGDENQLPPIGPGKPFRDMS